MLRRIEGYWISIISPGSFFMLRFTAGPFPPGTNVYANIALSEVNTMFSGNDPDSKFAADANIVTWTFYEPNGTQSAPQVGDSSSNAVAVDNCATITFMLSGARVAAKAQINVLRF